MAREKLELLEVSPRDGLQNESTLVSTAVKLDLINRILGAGFGRPAWRLSTDRQPRAMKCSQ